MPADPRCPLCGKPADPLHRPFCSRGCQDRDLLEWLDEGYRLPAGPADAGGVEGGLDSEPERP